MRAPECPTESVSPTTENTLDQLLRRYILQNELRWEENEKRWELSDKRWERTFKTLGGLFDELKAVNRRLGRIDKKL